MIRSRPLESLLVAWGVLAASTGIWVPAFRGGIGERPVALLVTAGIAGALAGAAAFALRRRAATPRDALVEALPALGLVAAAAVVATIQVQRGADLRGEPIFLWFGVALWTTWAALVVATAWLARARWNRPGALALTAFVVLLGLPLLTFRID
ncbi:MAG TPA: hypothetical protein VM290_09355 [Gaiellaceae bacterium]|nr:hypothetical protein [Gaiellaceae bacterium]